MPTVEVRCPRCELNLQIEGEALAGTQVTCPSCQQLLHLEGAPGSSAVRAVLVAPRRSLSPGLLLAAGAGVMLLAIAALLGAYLLGQSGAEDIADAGPAAPPVKPVPVEPLPAEPLPAEPGPPREAEVLPRDTPPRSTAPADPLAQPPPQATDRGVPPAEPPKVAQPATPPDNLPPRKTLEGEPPFGEPNPLEQPEGATPPMGFGGGNDGGVPAPPLIIQVPVPVPILPEVGSRNGKEDADCNVDILFERTDIIENCLVVDNRTGPGWETTFGVKLDRDPEVKTTVLFDPPDGVVIDPPSVEFTPGLDMGERRVGIRGDGSNPLTGHPSVIRDVGIEIKSDGLAPRGPESFKVKLVRRNRFVDDDGSVWEREDRRGGTTPDLTRWTMTPRGGGAPVQLKSEAYRAGYVQLQENMGLFRVRIFDSRIRRRNTPLGAVDEDSDTYNAPGGFNGHWE